MTDNERKSRSRLAFHTFWSGRFALVNQKKKKKKYTITTYNHSSDNFRTTTIARFVWRNTRPRPSSKLLPTTRKSAGRPFAFPSASSGHGMPLFRGPESPLEVSRFSRRHRHSERLVARTRWPATGTWGPISTPTVKRFFLFQHPFRRRSSWTRHLCRS